MTAVVYRWWFQDQLLHEEDIPEEVELQPRPDELHQVAKGWWEVVGMVPAGTGTVDVHVNRHSYARGMKAE